jgi:hypothetical protein
MATKKPKRKNFRKLEHREWHEMHADVNKLAELVTREQYKRPLNYSREELLGLLSARENLVHLVHGADYYFQRLKLPPAPNVITTADLKKIPKVLTQLPVKGATPSSSSGVAPSDISAPRSPSEYHDVSLSGRRTGPPPWAIVTLAPRGRPSSSVLPAMLISTN